LAFFLPQLPISSGQAVFQRGLSFAFSLSVLFVRFSPHAAFRVHARTV
jgi:hypothetical protein